MKTLEGLGRESEGTLGNAFEKRKIAFLVMNIAAMFLSLFDLNVFDHNVCVLSILVMKFDRFIK